MPPPADPTTDSDPAGVPAWWGAAVLTRIWGLVADRLEGRGLRPQGRVQVVDLDRAERHALSDLVGRPVTTDRVVLDLAELDARLRLRSGAGLVDAAERVLQRCLVDRGAQRVARQSRLTDCERAASEWVTGHPDLDWPWTTDWVGGMRRDGFLSRLADPSGLLLLALTVLHDRREALAGSTSAVPVARSELAARTAHDAHALDPDRRLSTAVLRALATRSGKELPSDAADRRELWESAGVLVDSVSSTCLVWNVRLRAGPSTPPRHLTWWDLQRGLEPATGQRLLVCENPRVLEAVAERELDEVGVVCTMGRPNLVTQELLGRARRAGCTLDYHGDFDWPGIAMANAALAGFGARPWLMSASDYESAPASLPLSGASVEPLWAAELGASMRHRALAVHEEAVLPRILGALAEAR